MQIFVRTLTTGTITLSVESSDMVASVKAKLHGIDGISPAEQRLLFGGKQLDTDDPATATLAEYSIGEGSTLDVCLRLRGGGGKKRKKKTFTTPKKGKHEHKSAGLDAVLGRYRVDEATGTVERLRKECPNEECGPGVFMAEHADRLACGRCGLTYVVEKQSVAIDA